MAGAIRIVSPVLISASACLMVLHGVADDMQLLLSFPFTPFTYHVVLAKTVPKPKEPTDKH